MRRSPIIVALMSSMMLPAFAETVTYNWVGGETGSWASPDSFSPRGNPGAEDDVLLPAGITVKLNAQDAAELAAANAIRRIRPDDGCALEVDTGDSDKDILFAFTFQADEGRNRGKLIKKGAGALWLRSMRDEFGGSSGMYADYYANFDVVEGSLKLPQDAVAGLDVKLGNIAISNNASFFTLATTGDALTYTYVRELWGESGAVVTNTAPLENAANQVLYSNGDNVSVFAGRLCAPVRWRGAGYVHFTGVENTTGSTFTQNSNRGLGFSGPHAGVMSFGTKGEASSIGKSGEIYAREDGGAFKYLGSGEETDANFCIGSEESFPYPGYLSGGDTGGLVWKGLWYPVAAARQQRLVISGDGPKTNVMKGAIQKRNYDGVDYSFFIRKQGAGTWRIEESSEGLDTYYQMLGVWAVDEGTLQFTSLAEKGFVSSLGMATDLFEDYCGAKDVSKSVPYAFTLGGDSTEGALEYTGTVDEFCSERPAWLYGDGAFVNDGSAKIRFRGVSSVAEGESPAARAIRFTVRGAGAAENEILDITDSAERPVSVVKEGSGTWVLGGEQSFRGTLDVKGGRLIVRRPETYTWFRWTITSKEGTVGDANSYFQMQEFALFNEEGMRQNYGLSLNGSYASLQPGQVAYGTDKRQYITAAGRDIDCLFDDLKQTESNTYGWNGTMRAPNETSVIQTPVRGNRLSWIPIVMRLPSDADEIESYDIVYYQNSAHVRSVTSYFVDGSVDGVHWDRLSTVDTVGDVKAGYWQYRGESFGAGGQRDKAHANGCGIASSPSTLPDVFNNVESVSVDRGAELVCEGDIEIPALSVDCQSGGGAFKGCRFAETGGFIDLVNLPDDASEIDIGWTFDGCTGVGNIKDWPVRIDGEETSRYSVKMTAGNSFSIVRTGLRLIIR